MNKRIQELVELCTTQYRDGHSEYVDQVDVEKFAELIVRECIRFVGDEDSLKVKQMKEHFGVEK